MTEHAVWGALRHAALAYPGAVEEFPWDESVVKVKQEDPRVPRSTGERHQRSGPIS
jgi:hypothetical protein